MTFTLLSHPLQELTVPSYVTNDTYLVGGPGTEELSRESISESLLNPLQEVPTVNGTNGPNVLIMTGPNYSGKSIYLKQVALIVYMAHVGCFISADRAIIGITDKILTRVTTRETVSKIQSAFMIDLQQISSALCLATHRSLLIIDEFGKGTDANGLPTCFKFYSLITVLIRLKTAQVYLAVFSSTCLVWVTQDQKYSERHIFMRFLSKDF